MTPALRHPQRDYATEIATSSTIRRLPSNTNKEADAKSNANANNANAISNGRSASATETSIADLAHRELSEMLKRCTLHRNSSNNNNSSNSSSNYNDSTGIYREKFPMACRSLLHRLEGNHNCIDCNARDPEWAAISYGALVCIHCSGKHRSLGVAVSQVRSVSMDHWTHKEVVSMLEGGNAQLKGFFARHALTRDEFEKQQQQKNQQKNQKQSKQNQQQKQSASASASTSTSTSTSTLTTDNLTTLRYKTKAALFYKSQLEAHVVRLLEDPAKRPYKGRSRRPKRVMSEPQLARRNGNRNGDGGGNNGNYRERSNRPISL